MAQGSEARTLFYKKIPATTRLIDKDKRSPFVEYIQSCHKSNVIPQAACFMGRSSCPRQAICTAGFKMGDIQAQALGNGLRLITQPLKSLNLARNRLTNKGAVPILSNIRPDLENLDMSSNPTLRIASYQLIGDRILNPKYRL